MVQRYDFDSPIGQGLPVAGQTGTLSDAFVDHPVAGRLTGKTGTLNNPPFNVDPPAVKAFAGYLPVEGGGAVEYVVILNGPTITDQSEYRPIWDQLADTLDTYPAGPSPAEVGPTMNDGVSPIVAGPRSVPRLPVRRSLVAIPLIPVAALSALLVWSDAQADEHEATLRSTPDGSDESAPPPVNAAPELTTELMSYRRMPNQMVTAGDDARLADTMDQLASFVDDRSCLAVSVDGHPVIAHNADVRVIPASTHKLLVAAAALEVLGPDHTFTTSVSAPAAVDGVIDGDLVLVGGGDPLLVADDYPIADDSYPEFNTTSFDRLADAVVAAGVTTVNGSVVGDGARYDDEFVIPSWGPASRTSRPARSTDSSSTTQGSSAVRDANAIRTRPQRVSSPDSSASGMFRCPGALASARPTRPSRSSRRSSRQPLTAVLAEMLTTSDNDTAEMLLKELGVADVGEGTVAAGLNVLDRTLRSAGVPMDGVRLVDASGLSSDNRITCAALLAVLRRVEGGPIADALPVAGRTGTLTDQFVGTSMEGRLMAKTGTLGNPPVELDPPAVKGLAGLLETTEGSTIEFRVDPQRPRHRRSRQVRPVLGASPNDWRPTRADLTRRRSVLAEQPLRAAAALASRRDRHADVSARSVLLPGGVLPLHVFELARIAT